MSSFEALLAATWHKRSLLDHFLNRDYFKQRCGLCDCVRDADKGDPLLYGSAGLKSSACPFQVPLSNNPQRAVRLHPGYNIGDKSVSLLSCSTITIAVVYIVCI